LSYTLIIGGASSGKSRYVINTLKGEDEVIFIATGIRTDPEMENRIEKHRAERPSKWITIEEPCNIKETLEKTNKKAKYIIIDCLTFWISNLIYIEKMKPENIKNKAEEVALFLETMDSKTYVITNEVGMGIIPSDPDTRSFRKIAGEVNQIFAKYSSEAYLIVSGIPLKLK